MVIKIKATQQGLITTEPKPRRPATRKECDALLKALTPAARTAQHEHTREYIQEWINEIKANIPAHIRTARPQATTSVAEGNAIQRSTGNGNANANADVNAASSEADPLDAINFGCSDEELAELPDVSERARHEHEHEHQHEHELEQTNDDIQIAGLANGFAAGSINDFSSCMVPDVPAALNGQMLQMDTHACQANWLCIDYVNANGLGSAKLATACGHLGPNMIFFISETWHIHDAKMRTVAGVVAISPELHRPALSRGKGGLALLAHECVASRLQIVATCEYYISVIIEGVSVSGIYLPPSMDCTAVKTVLDQLPTSTDIIIGDLNVRLGKDTRTAERDRCDAISAWCSRKGLGLRTPDTQVFSSKIDHILARGSIHSKEYHVTTAPFRTDHPLLTIQVRTNGQNTGQHSTRFNIHKLNIPQTAVKLCNAVEAMATTVHDKLVHASNHPTEAHNARMTIESLDDNLTCLVQTALKETVGTRRPSGLYTRGGPAKPKSMDTASAILAIRAAQRESKAKCELLSLDETLSPQQEAVKHYTAIYRRVADRPRERSGTAQTQPAHSWRQPRQWPMLSRHIQAENPQAWMELTGESCGCSQVHLSSLDC